MRDSSGRFVGIDLGTTNSAVATMDESGKPVVLPDSEGNPLTPSVVYFDDDGVMVGRDAKWYALAEPARVVSEIKREMGSRTYQFPYRGRGLPPEVVSALILKKLKQEAEARIGPIAGAVIAVPFYFDHTRRKATEDAGRIAGLNVIDIINEPVAATLCYAYGRGQLGHDEPADTAAPTASRPVLVYDLGGGTFDVAYVKYDSRRFQVVATDGDVRLGGTDWTRRLLDRIAEKYRDAHGIDLRQDPQANQRLLQDCEEAKHALSKRTRVSLSLGADSRKLDMEIARDEFEQWTAELLLRTESTTCDVLEAAQGNRRDLADIILVGGASRMPMVRRMLERVSSLSPDTTLPAGEAVALGAVIHAAIVRSRRSSRLGSIDQVNVNSHSLGIAVLDRKQGRERTQFMIRRNTPLPHTVTRRFKTVVPDQRGALVQVLEGESPEPEGCLPIGECRLSELPTGLPAGSPIEVTYSYAANGQVHVTARDPIGGKFSETEIFLSAGLTAPEVESWREFVATVSVV